MEASICQVSMTGHPTVTIASVYLSPQKAFLESDLKSLLALGDSVILAGDFNSKHSNWNCRVTNTRGRALDRLASRVDATFVIASPDTPTRYGLTDLTSNRQDILDIALLKNIALQMRPLEVINELDSDHRPVLLRLGPPCNVDPPTKKVIDFQKLSEHLKSLDSNHLALIPDKIESLDEANAASLHLTNHLREAISECTRDMPNGFTRRQLPDDARELISDKNAKRRAYNAHPTPDNRRALWAAQRAVKSRIKVIRDDEWDRKLSELKPSHVAFYSLARHLKTEPMSSTPPLVRPNLPLAFEDIDKAECLADSLEEQCNPSTTSIDRAHVQKVDEDLAIRLARAPEGEPITPTSFDEVHRIIKDLHAKKAPGPDSINNKTLKLLPDQIINLLVVIFNTLMANCSFPDWWKEATVIGIPKPGKPRNLPTSYRPISLLNTLAKVYEKILLTRLKAVVERDKLLNEQYGFRSLHSCVHQVHRLTEHILKGFSIFARPTPTGVIFFDIAKAFDKVWHAGLLYKLYQLGVPDRLARLLREFLTNRTFRYRLDGTLSSPRPIRAGVPQGSVLSPLLYALYTSDMPRSPGVELAQFADDTALFTTHTVKNRMRLKLQEAVNRLDDWFRLWRIDVNPEKSTAVLFTGKRGRHINPNWRAVTLHGRPIAWQRTAKYLGVTLDMQMNFTDHIKRARRKASFVLSRLYPMICIKSKMSLRHKVTLYKTCIRPIMTYASVVFAHCKKSDINRLQTVQNKFTRMATGAPWFTRNVDLHRDLELPSIAQYLKQLSKNYFEKAASHTNPLVVQAIDYDPDLNDPPDKRRPKHVLYDPDDQLTTDNLTPAQVGQHTLHNTYTQRPRRRERRPRFITIPRRGLHPWSRGRSD